MAPAVEQLRGFRRVRLEPGSSKLVTFRLTADDLAHFSDMRRRVAEPGYFTVSVGPNSDAPSQRHTRFELTER